MDFSKVKFDIIIQGGQSNAEGCGIGPVTRELTPSVNAFYLYAEKTVTIDEENLHSLFTTSRSSWNRQKNARVKTALRWEIFR